MGEGPGCGQAGWEELASPQTEALPAREGRGEGRPSSKKRAFNP